MNKALKAAGIVLLYLIAMTIAAVIVALIQKYIGVWFLVVLIVIVLGIQWRTFYKML